MPRVRLVHYRGDAWRLSDLARAHGLLPQTLAGRLHRGYPLDRALHAGLCTRSEAGRRGYVASRWRDD
jgi:hypothetical protein